jgi:hypothetical protein
MNIERIACAVFALACLALGVLASIVTEQRDLAPQSETVPRSRT